MRVLVTGGSGFVGTRLQEFQPKWHYISSSDYDLTMPAACSKMMRDYQPDAILHLAARVGGIKENSMKQAEFFHTNTMINTNIVQAAYKAGVKRLLASLSTCAFPDVIKKYPLKEEDLLKGPPAETNLSYGFTKRSLYIQILSYRKQYGVNYSCFCPSNIYGPEDNFDPTSSHFVPSMIRKFSEAEDGETLEFWGTGKPLRQQLYVDDLCQIIEKLLLEHNSDQPLLVCPNENLSISKMISILQKQLKKSVKISYNYKLDGQFRKDGSNKRLLKLIGEYDFTSFEDGVRQTYKWYERNYK